jgi:LysR family transcriptional regulator, cys regulon transcriptional activator
MAGQILREVDTIKQVAQEFSDEKQGSLSIATTHTQARYALPPSSASSAPATPTSRCT